MADISKVVLPNGDEYNFKDAYARRLHAPDAIETKTYTDVIGTANSNNGASFFYMSFRPAVYTDLWHIKVRVTATIPSNINYAEVSIFDFYGSSATVSGYACLNQLRSTSYRPFYYHSVFLYTQKGFNNGCSCYVGFNLTSSTNPTNTSLKRTFKVELLYYDNCEVELLDSLVTPTNIPNRAAHTDYYTSTDTSISNYNAFSIGLKQSGDADTTTITTLSNGNGSYTIDSAVYRYQLLFEKDANTLTPLNNNNNTTGTTKTMLTEVEFDPFGRIYYYSTTTTLAAGAIGGAGSYLWAYASTDLRYTFNITTTSFTANQAVYLVVTPTSGGKCKIASTLPVTQTLPSTADDNWYILLGRAYSGYQICLWPTHPVFMHNGMSIQRVLPQTALANSTTAGLMTPAEKTKLTNIKGIPAVTASDNGKVLTVNSSGEVVASSYTMTTLYRQFWSSTDSISLTLAEDGKTYQIWCAGSSSGAYGAIGDSSYGAFIFVSNGKYLVQYKGSEITVDETNGVLTITSTANIAMAIVEM